MKLGALTVTWKDDGKAFEYTRDGKRYRYDVAAKQATVERRRAGRGAAGGSAGAAAAGGRARRAGGSSIRRCRPTGS